MLNMVSVLLEIEVISAKLWFGLQVKKIHFIIVIDHCESRLRQIKGGASQRKTFFSTYRWNGEINDRMTYFGNSYCHRIQPYKYTCSHLLRRHKLHRFGKDQGYNH